MKNILLAITFVIFAAFPTHAQLQGQALIDSLEAELPKAKGDTNEVKLLKYLGESYKSINPDKGVEYGLKAANLANEIDWKMGQGLSYNAIGLNYVTLSNYPKAIEYYKKVLEINKDIGNETNIAANLANIGLIYDFQSNFTKALEYYENALEISQKIENNRLIAGLLGNIGNIHWAQSKYPDALEYFDKALKISEEMNDKSGVGTHLGNIGNRYYEQSDYSEALKYYERSLAINKEIGDKNNIAIFLGNIGLIYNAKKDFKKALQYSEEASEINKELGNKYGLAGNLESIGRIYKEQNNYPKALEYYRNALRINEMIGNDKFIANILRNIGDLYLTLSQDSISLNPDELNEYMSFNKDFHITSAIEYSQDAIGIYENIGELDKRSLAFKTLAEAYELQGNYKQAYAAHKKYKEFQDSVFNQEKSKEIGRLEAERAFLEEEYAQQERDRIKKENDKARDRLQYLGIGAIVVAFGVLLLLSGRMNISEWLARALVFLTLIFLFEFLLVLLDPITDEYSEGIPIIKFCINMCLALIIFPMHQYFERKVSLKVVKPDSMSNEQMLAEYRKRKDEEKL
ncbi:MAG: hypothetical protein Kapaf2KO_21570 [Candidatus Kapaibacteriales bacterium]